MIIKPLEVLEINRRELPKIRLLFLFKLTFFVPFVSVRLRNELILYAAKAQQVPSYTYNDYWGVESLFATFLGF